MSGDMMTDDEMYMRNRNHDRKHFVGCWRIHHSCAIKRIEELEREEEFSRKGAENAEGRGEDEAEALRSSQ